MKHKGVKIFVGIIISILLLVLLVYAFRKKIVTHFMPTIEQIGDISITIVNDTATIKSNLAVKNNSPVWIKIDTLKYKLSLFDKMYVQDIRYIGTTIKGFSPDTFGFLLKVPYITLLEDLKKERKRGDSANYTVNIYIQYSTAFIKDEFPINKSAKIKIPQPPEIEVEDVSYKKIRRKYILADVKVKVKNNSDITLTIKNLDYSINIENQGHLNGSFAESLTIKSNEIEYVTIPIKINIDNIGKTTFDVLMNRDQYTYTLKLIGTFESIDPVEKTFNLDVTKSGEMELKK